MNKIFSEILFKVVYKIWICFLLQKYLKTYSLGFIKTTKSQMGFLMSEVEEIDIFDWIRLINYIKKI